MMIADIHSHILPYVDDGALVLGVTRQLVEQMYLQDVRYVCCTPHLRKGMFESPDEEIIWQFERVQQFVSEHYGTQLHLYLSREYHFDQLFREKLTNGEILPLGNSRNILLEFSHRHTPESVEDAVSWVLSYGYTPVIAHIERYSKEVCAPDTVARLIDLGAWIQLNASAVIGRGGMAETSACKKLLREGLVHAVASDAHDPEDRPSELDKAARFLTKKYGASCAEELLYINPMQILGIRRET